jgi:hypothetical protein
VSKLNASYVSYIKHIINIKNNVKTCDIQNDEVKQKQKFKKLLEILNIVMSYYNKYKYDIYNLPMKQTDTYRVFDTSDQFPVTILAGGNKNKNKYIKYITKNNILMNKL